jgi:hypothetical protein
MEKTAHCCLIDDSWGPSVMSKIIMEELGLSSTNENARTMLSYNSLLIQMDVGGLPPIPTSSFWQFSIFFIVFRSLTCGAILRT